MSWQVEGTTLAGTMPVTAAPSAEVVKVGEVKFAAPAGSSPVRHVLKAVLTAAEKTVAEDSLQLYFCPPHTPELPPPVSFYDPPGRLRRLVNEMRSRNYLTPTGSEAFPVLVTSVLDETVKNKLRGEHAWS